MPPNTQVDQFVKISQTIKRRLEEDTPVPPKKVCQTLACKEVAEDSRPPSTLEDPLLLPLESCTGERLDEENKENCVAPDSNPNFDSILAKTLLAAANRDKTKPEAEAEERSSPRVIVEHQPLPSIYELGQQRDCDQTSDPEDGEDSDAADSDDDSAMFEAPPPSAAAQCGKSVSGSWGWSGTFSISGSVPLPTPPPSPVPTVLQPAGAPPPAPGTPYTFLDQSNPRIECDENGKSYLQLGTFNHHLPVTPVLQPKPTTLTPRRPVFRPAPPPPARPPNPTPPCDHSACLTRRVSPCYRQQRSRMLNVSLHKLHIARQRTDSNLRRSVLICNMLRHIEEESDLEAREQEATFSQHHHQPDQAEQPYWTNLNSPAPANSYVAQSPAPYRDQHGYNSSTESFEPPLKDFNSAFRQTPLPGLGGHPEVESGVEEDRGINWSSVLSLSSQSDLDPLNNNSFSDSWSGSPGSGDLTDVDLSQHTFDDISWKLTPVSADDVLKAFPGDENLFQCPA